jgi:hypothetical protein
MLLDELADYLSTNGLGTVGTNLFKGFLPDETNEAGAIYETGGFFPVRGFASGPGQAKAERPRVQVVFRSTSYQSARTKADTAFKLLDGLGDVTLSGTRYLWVGAVHSPFLMARDQNQRVLIACNYDVVKSLSTA